MVSIFNC